MAETTSGLYRSIFAQPQAVRALLMDWHGPELAAERLAQTRRIFLAGIGTSFHAAVGGEYLLRLAGADAWGVRSFEFVQYPRPLRADDSVIVISHRGSKLHGKLAVQRALEAKVATIGITGKNSEMQGPEVVIETVAQEPSSTHSISYVSTLTRLAQIVSRLAALLGHAETAQRAPAGPGISTGPHGEYPCARRRGRGHSPRGRSPSAPYLLCGRGTQCHYGARRRA